MKAGKIPRIDKKRTCLQICYFMAHNKKQSVSIKELATGLNRPRSYSRIYDATKFLKDNGILSEKVRKVKNGKWPAAGRPTKVFTLAQDCDLNDVGISREEARWLLDRRWYEGRRSAERLDRGLQTVRKVFTETLEQTRNDRTMTKKDHSTVFLSVLESKLTQKLGDLYEDKEFKITLTPRVRVTDSQLARVRKFDKQAIKECLRIGDYEMAREIERHSI